MLDSSATVTWKEKGPAQRGRYSAWKQKVAESAKARLNVAQSAAPSATDVANALLAARRLQERHEESVALIQAWIGLERALQFALSKGEMAAAPSASAMLAAAYSEGYIDASALNKLRRSLELRNQIVHGSLDDEVPAEAVSSVIDAARELIEPE